MLIEITRQTIDQLLDHRQLEVRMTDKPPGVQRWWAIRRSGMTKRWSKPENAHRIYIPWKAGLKLYGSITEADFLSDGTLNPAFFRVKPRSG